ncbi:MAG: NADP-specific glutamate dehydrogenase, partial [Bacilli bacterium]|nr:NADP-specific glutamate dehydrogenase [Bacilli bacterium]
MKTINHINPLLMIDLKPFINEPEFYNALKEMFSSLDESVLSNPKYQSIFERIVEPDRVITFDVHWL